MRIRSITTTIAAIFAIGGCYPHFAPTAPITPDEKPTKTDAYLYGRFAINTWSDLGYAFVIGCEDGKEYQIPFMFQDETTVVAIKVAPSSCSIRGALFVNGTDVRKRKDDIERYMSNWKLAPGTAYYLGDFTVSASGDRLSTEWKIERHDDEYKETTEELKAIWQHFATMRTEKRLLDNAFHVQSSGSAADNDMEIRLVPCLQKEWKCNDLCASSTAPPGCRANCKEDVAECIRQSKSWR